MRRVGSVAVVSMITSPSAGASLMKRCRPSLAMPRGRWPPGRVRTTVSVAVSITDTVADFSFGT